MEWRLLTRSETKWVCSRTLKPQGNLMEGDLSLLSVPDLLQTFCLGGYSRDIHLFDGPTQLGVIAIRKGHVDRCFGFGMWGTAAFYKLVTLQRGRYKVNDAQDTLGSDETLAAVSWQALLMEAARLQDEAERVAQSAMTGRVIAFPTPTPRAATGSGAPLRPTRPLSVLQMLEAASPAAGSGAAVAVAPQRSSAEGAASAHPDITNLLEEATTCYLRRDLTRAEALLQQCLVLRPGDKRALQNLERIRRKKSP